MKTWERPSVDAVSRANIFARCGNFSLPTRQLSCYDWRDHQENGLWTRDIRISGLKKPLICYKTIHRALSPKVAGACSLSTSRLSHLFKAQVGTTVGKFRCTCRFKKAKRMLADTPEVAIKEIAYTLGYHHTSSFTRAFEHNVGESPTDYRKHELHKKWRAAVIANKKHKRLTS